MTKDDVANDGDPASSASTAPETDGGWDSLWEFAPSLPEMLSRSRELVESVSRSGHRIGDFEIRRLLGEGAFGKVYLARQVSLDREVALKVTADLGHEGRMMARLQHSHIVQVFSETIDQDRKLRWLCMQYVPGATLQRTIRGLRELERERRDGQAILRIIDVSSTSRAALDPVSLRNREILSTCRLDEAVCLIGRQLAEALAYAHGRGVLHLDIKPANVIVNQYGLPMLMDFSLSFSATGMANLGAAVFGGTWGYMSPEQIEALNPAHPRRADAVGEASDLYSLGAVLLDLFTGEPALASEKSAMRDGRLPVEDPRMRQDVSELLGRHGCPRSLRWIVQRCLRREPRARFDSAGELAEYLAGCFDLLRARRRLPTTGRLTRWATTGPFSMILWLTIPPNFAASAMNIVYNSLFVIQDLDPDQRATFGPIVFWYNFIVLLVMAPLVSVAMLPPAKDWYRLARGVELPPERVDEVRRQVLLLPRWGLLLGAIGWLPFALVIPSGMEWWSGPVNRGVLFHVSVAFSVTGLIMMCVNFYVITFVVLRGMYPRLWGDPSRFHAKATVELAGVPRRNRLIQVLAGLTPLGAAAFLVLLGPEQFTEDAFLRFRGVIVVLIAAGIAGFWLATSGTTLLNRCVDVLTARQE